MVLIPKLIVRVRFPSPAHVKAQVRGSVSGLGLDRSRHLLIFRAISEPADSPSAENMYLLPEEADSVGC
jgi:hypothetical protein